MTINYAHGAISEDALWLEPWQLMQAVTNVMLPENINTIIIYKIITTTTKKKTSHTSNCILYLKHSAMTYVKHKLPETHQGCFSLASSWLNSTLHSTEIPQPFSADSGWDTREGAKQGGTIQALGKGRWWGRDAPCCRSSTLFCCLPTKECEKKWEHFGNNFIWIICLSLDCLAAVRSRTNTQSDKAEWRHGHKLKPPE